MPLDGTTHLLVAMDLLSAVYALLFAWPFVPDRVVDADDHEPVGWVHADTPATMQAALQELLRNSDVLGVSLSRGHTVEDITLAAAVDACVVSWLFGLHLYDPTAGVPVVCRQLFEHIAAVYRALRTGDPESAADKIVSREALIKVLRRYQILPYDYPLPGLVRTEDAGAAQQQEQPGADHHSALVRFCSERAVSCVQGYFAAAPAFFLPREVAAACQ